MIQAVRDIVLMTCAAWREVEVDDLKVSENATVVPPPCARTVESGEHAEDEMIKAVRDIVLMLAQALSVPCEIGSV
jgi:hypothetical protein